jgi:hypothetical protein
MPATQGKAPFDSLARRGHQLAERRLAHFAELYRSGRWKLYYRTEPQFAAQMLEAIGAARVWARLAGSEPPAFNAPFTAPTAPPKKDGMRPAA